MTVNDVFTTAIQAASPLSVSIAVIVEWTQKRIPTILKGPIVWISSIALGIVMALASAANGTPAPFDQLSHFGLVGTVAGLILYGVFAGILASGGKDILSSLAGKIGGFNVSNFSGAAPLSAADQELSSMPLGARPLPEIQPIMEGPVWDVLDMGTRAIKSFTGFPADILLLIVKRVAGVIVEPELAWAKIAQIVDRVRAGTALEVALSEVLG
jgi:hypothetical protein